MELQVPTRPEYTYYHVDLALVEELRDHFLQSTTAKGKDLMLGENDQLQAFSSTLPLEYRKLHNN